MEETPEVRSEIDGDTVRLTLSGELTEAVRRPLIRVMTDLLLERHDLHRVELHLSGIGYMNSGGMAVLVQVQKLAAPRGIEVVLVAPPPVVIRPLQLSGLWRRFPVEAATTADAADG